MLVSHASMFYEQRQQLFPSTYALEQPLHIESIGSDADAGECIFEIGGSWPDTFSRRLEVSSCLVP
jgi:hypothetical protein